MKNIFKFYMLSSVRNLQKHSVRSLLTILGISFGMALYLAIAIIQDSTHAALQTNFESIAGSAQITISAGSAGFSEETLEQVRQFPGVKYAVPLIEERVYFKGSKQKSQSIYILGIDLLAEKSVRTYSIKNRNIVDDPLVFLNQPDSIIVTQDFAKLNKLNVDDSFWVSTPSGSKKLTIRGLLEPEGPAKAYGGSIGIMDIDGARFFFRKEGKLDRIDVVPDGSTSELTEKLRAHLGPGFLVDSPQQQSLNTQTMLAGYEWMLTLFSSLALLVGLFMVSNSIRIAVVERRREIGVLRALGATKQIVFGLFAMESICIGFIGACLGVVLGRWLSIYMMESVTTSLSHQFHTRLDVTHIVFKTNRIWLSLLLGTASAFLSSFWPVWKAAQISPLEALKNHEEDKTIQRLRIWSKTDVIALLVFLTTACSISMGWNRYWAPLEFINQGLAVLSSAFFGPSLVRIMLKMASIVLPYSNSWLNKMVFNHLLIQRKRADSTVMTLMVGLFLVMLISSVRSSFQNTLRDWIAQVISADIVVSSNGRLFNLDVTPVDEDIVEDLQRISGVRKISKPYGSASRIINLDRLNKRYVLKAFDRPPPWVGFNHLSIQSENSEQIAEQFFTASIPVVLISENYLTKHPDLKIGQSFGLPTPTKGWVEFKVLGIVRDFAGSEGVFYLPRTQYISYWNDRLVSGVAVRIEPGVSAEIVRREIDATVGEKYGTVSIMNSEIRQMMQQAVDESFSYTKSIEFAALWVGLLGLMNAFLIMIIERTKEIGTLRAIGATRAQVVKMLVSEAMILGLFGAMVASLLGSLIGKLWVDFSLAYALGWIVQFHLPLSQIVRTIGLGTLVAVIGVILPAYRAARLDVVKALREE